LDAGSSGVLFFFQAEDGIRGGHVTGVQTCALPISERRQLTVMLCDLVGSTGLSARLDPEDMGAVMDAYHAACARVVQSYDGFLRSEERRVGKECRSRWLPGDDSTKD